MTSFSELGEFLAIPRATSLLLSPDASGLAATIATLSSGRKKYINSIWRIDTADGPAQRLTRSAEGEANPVFLPDGSLLFISSRPDPTAQPAENNSGPGDKPALWSLPAGRGEAHRSPRLRVGSPRWSPPGARRSSCCPRSSSQASTVRTRTPLRGRSDATLESAPSCITATWPGTRIPISVPTA